MTRFAAISASAMRSAARFVRHKSQCLEYARITGQKMTEFLEAPADSISFVKLDSELHPIGDKLDEPVLTLEPDGFWYFGLKITFGSPGSTYVSSVVLKFGVQVAGERATIKLENAYAVKLDEPSTWSTMLEEIAKGLEADYASDLPQQSRAIGFIQSGTST